MRPTTKGGQDGEKRNRNKQIKKVEGLRERTSISSNLIRNRQGLRLEVKG